MISVLAVSNFPNHFNETKLRPELLKRGIKEVTFIESKNLKEINADSSIDSVICFFDLMSHGAYYKIRELAKKAHKNFFLLKRKSSSWPEKIFALPEAKKDNPMAPPRSVIEKDLNPMLRLYMDLTDKGVCLDDMITPLKRYWTGRPLKNKKQLCNYISKLENNRNANCPGFFKEWKKSKAGSNQEEDKLAILEASEEPEKRPLVAAINQSDDASEVSIEDLLKISESENSEFKKLIQSLIEQISMLRDQIESRDMRIAALEKQVSIGRSSTQIREGLGALRKLMELKVMSFEEVIDKIEHFI